jgi:hypothetical protein
VTRYVIRTTLTYVLRFSTFTLLPGSHFPLSLKLSYRPTPEIDEEKVEKALRKVNEWAAAGPFCMTPRHLQLLCMLKRRHCWCDWHRGSHAPRMSLCGWQGLGLCPAPNICCSCLPGPEAKRNDKTDCRRIPCDAWSPRSASSRLPLRPLGTFFISSRCATAFGLVRMYWCMRHASFWKNTRTTMNTSWCPLMRGTLLWCQNVI